MGAEIAAFVIGCIGIGFGVWQWLATRSLRREAQLLRLPMVEIESDAGWEPGQLGTRELRVHADLINRGPGHVRDVQWGVAIDEVEQAHRRNHPMLAEGKEITYEMFVLSESLASKVTGPPHERITWWVRYSNAVGDRVEMRLSGDGTLSEPILLPGVRRGLLRWPHSAELTGRRQRAGAAH